MELKDWRRWFAWRPIKVRVGPVWYCWVWLEHVERRLVVKRIGQNCWDEWEYKI